MNRLARVLAPAAIVLAAAPAGAQTLVIDNPPGTSAAWSAGPYTIDRWLGQSFLAPTIGAGYLPTLTSWTVFIQAGQILPGELTNSALITATTKLFTLGADGSLGGMLYSKSHGNLPQADLTQLAVDLALDDWALDPAARYLLMFEMGGPEDDMRARTSVGVVSSDTYAGGNLYVGRDDGTYAQYTGWELKLVANFGTVAAPVITPEPSTIVLLATGLAAVGAFGWRRRQPI